MVSNLFLAGCFVRALREQLWRNHTSWRYGDVACMFACLGALAFHEVIEPGIHGALIHLSFASLILALSAAQGPIAALLASKVFVYLGEISYSLYLSHGIVQRVLKVVLPFDRFDASGWLIRIGVAAVYWIIILASAAALYHLVEKPGRDWCRRFYESYLLSRVRNQPISR
jgi:peptidoglycan/LPS O-acetylase OafA/YrhL